jgi:transcriptional regulator GlxA family with amidase domain
MQLTNLSAKCALLALLLSPVQALGQATNKTKPIKLGVLLFPAFEMIDVFGPLDALQFLAFKTRLELYMISTSSTLDPVSSGPRSATMNPQNSSFGSLIQPTHTIFSPPDIDVLLVPGGVGTRAADLNATIQYIADVFPRLQYLIGVCTGVGLAARAGVLSGRRATTNKGAWATVTAFDPTVKWIGQARWVDDGKVWTTSGVSAGIDGILAWIASVYGMDLAHWIEYAMEYEWRNDWQWEPYAWYYGVVNYS